MLHHLFADSQVWRDDRPERSSAEWYRPTPLLVKLAKAEAALQDEAARSLFAQSWRERYPNGSQIIVPANTAEPGDLDELINGSPAKCLQPTAPSPTADPNYRLKHRSRL
jgi:hypothetical protein